MTGHVDHLAEGVARLAEADRARRAGAHDTAAFEVSVAQVHELIAIAESVRELVLTVDALSRGESRPVPADGVVRAGDPDPTPDMPVDDYCGTLGPHEHRSCTWPVGHEGPHVAGNGQIVMEVWS